MIKIGIIGSSQISEKFAQAVIDSNLDVKLTANYSRSIESAREFGTKFNISNQFINKVEMFKTIGLVYIATPNSLHYDDVKLALENNIHVLVEKPLTLKPEQTEELFILAASKNLILVEAIKTCSMNTYQEALNKLESIGNITAFRLNMMRAYANFPNEGDVIANIYRPEMDGGVVADLGSYALFPLIDYIYPEHLESDITFKTIKNNYGLDVETEVISKVESAQNNINGLITLSMRNQDNSKSYIYGTKGYITIDSLSQFNHIAFYDLDDNLNFKIKRSNTHLMDTELKYTVDLIKGTEHEQIHSKSKSVLVSQLLLKLKNDNQSK